MEKLGKRLKSLIKKYFIGIVLLIVLSRIIAQILAKRILLSKLFSYPLILVAIILFFIILIKSVKFAGTNHLFKIEEEKREKKINNYFCLSFIYSVLVILISINFEVRGFFNLLSGIIVLFALNAWVIFRLKAGEIEK